MDAPTSPEVEVGLRGKGQQLQAEGTVGLLGSVLGVRISLFLSICSHNFTSSGVFWRLCVSLSDQYGMKLSFLFLLILPLLSNRALMCCRLPVRTQKKTISKAQNWWTFPAMWGMKSVRRMASAR